MTLKLVKDNVVKFKQKDSKIINTIKEVYKRRNDFENILVLCITNEGKVSIIHGEMAQSDRCYLATALNSYITRWFTGG